MSRIASGIWAACARFPRIDCATTARSIAAFTVAAPAGTTGLVVTYAISSFGAGNGDPTTVYIDDFSTVIVPEPAMLGTLAFGMLGLSCRRRRR